MTKERYIAIRGADDNELLFVGKLLNEDAIIDYSYQSQWTLTGYFRYDRKKGWKYETSNILKPESNLFVMVDLTEQEHFLTLLRNQLPEIYDTED